MNIGELEVPNFLMGIGIGLLAAGIANIRLAAIVLGIAVLGFWAFININETWHQKVMDYQTRYNLMMLLLFEQHIMHPPDQETSSDNDTDDQEHGKVSSRSEQ